MQRQLLHLLLRAEGAAVTRQHIVDTLWDFAIGTERNRSTCACGTCGPRSTDHRPLVETVRGVGYRLRTD